MSSPQDAPSGNDARAAALPPAVWALLVAAATFGAFARAIGFTFLNWDDPANVFQNPYLTPSVTAAGLARLWTAPYFELYMPLTDTIWAVCALAARLEEPVPVPGTGLSHLDARVFHAAGILGHSLAAALAFLLLRRLTRSDAGAALGALLWAIHPVQAESVGWVTGNNNVFSGLFALASLNFYVTYAADTETMSRRRRGSLYAGATLAYLLALLCKPTAVAVPLLALALGFLWLRRPPRSLLAPLGLWFAVAIGWTVLTRASSAESDLVSVALWQRPLVALDALAFYLGKIAVPAALTVDYGRRLEIVVGGSWWAWANSALVLGTAAVLWRFWRRGIAWPATAFALLVLGVLPMLGLVPFYFLRMSTVADRYLYLAMLGPAFAVAAVMAKPPGERGPQGGGRVLRGVLSALVVLLGVRTFAHLPVWRDSVSLFSHALRVNPRSAVANNGLGVAYADTGQMEKAVPLFRRAIAIAPNESRGHYHLGATLANLERREEAVAPLREAVRLQPGFEEAWFLLGVNLARTGRAEEAEKALAEVARRNPNRAEALYIRGVLLGNLKRYADAERLFEDVVRLTPDHAEAHYSLGLVRERQGRPGDAAPAYREALRLAPTDRERTLSATALTRVEKR